MAYNSRKEQAPFSFEISSPSAAGIPIFEIIRRLEDEQHIKREDRPTLNNALNNLSKRDKVLKALCDIELGVNTGFAIKRLNSIIQQQQSDDLTKKQIKDPEAHLRELYARSISTGSGSFLPPTDVESAFPYSQSEAIVYPSSSTTATMPLLKSDNFYNDDISTGKESPINIRHPSPNSKHSTPKVATRVRAKSIFLPSGEEVFASYDTQSTIKQVVGETPIYSQPGNSFFWSKLKANLDQLLLRIHPSKSRSQSLKLALIVGTGSFNPLTRMHLRTFVMAKQYLEAREGYTVLGALLSPAHYSTVRERYRTNPDEIIPSPHRLAIAQLMVEESHWMSIDPWEITRRRSMDYTSLLSHASKVIQHHLGSNEVHVFYLCKPNAIPRLSPNAFSSTNTGCICVCRPLENAVLSKVCA